MTTRRDFLKAGSVLSMGAAFGLQEAGAAQLNANKTLKFASKSAHPFITLKGTAGERGLAYGKAAADRIHGSLAFYQKMFLDGSHVTWDQAKSASLKFMDCIKGYYKEGLEEMEGVAQGAGVKFEDILALNCRSEILFAKPDACTCTGFMPYMTKNGHTLLGQTWDWLIKARENTVIVRLEQPGLPSILFVTEAGIIGGKGVNSKGIGVCLNATSVGYGRVGVPLHLMYRQILNQTSISNALQMVTTAKRAGCGTFNIGSSEGFLLSVEYTPDNFDVIMAEDKPLVHTNHFISSLFRKDDKLKISLPDSFIRYNRVRQLTLDRNRKYDEQDLYTILTDHKKYPDSICHHEDPMDAPSGRFCSVYTMGMDLDEKTLWLSDGGTPNAAVFLFAHAVASSCKTLFIICALFRKLCSSKLPNPRQKPFGRVSVVEYIESGQAVTPALCKASAARRSSISPWRRKAAWLPARGMSSLPKHASSSSKHSRST